MLDVAGITLRRNPDSDLLGPVCICGVRTNHPYPQGNKAMAGLAGM